MACSSNITCPQKEGDCRNAENLFFFFYSFGKLTVVYSAPESVIQIQDMRLQTSPEP